MAARDQRSAFSGQSAVLYLCSHDGRSGLSSSPAFEFNGDRGRRSRPNLAALWKLKKRATSQMLISSSGSDIT